ncbi:CBS domain-containing protein [Methanocella sp. CWC-04]|uniref:CBS domain-containing protein n=1 Tax=Methanooceanicella nereidis TaxID=2052831 RepID=A0AAP2W630_9EURY|nr:CBS domain-containing protein [Methanocella sp. CWC-04]MCD1294928.1 CBS domain-containing protein [Methanocella sp. CWC-04]
MKQALTVDDIMIKSVKSIEIPGTRDEVLELMQKERISAVPVVKEGTLLGIVTRIDLLKHPEEEQIALLMTRNPITITPEEPLSEAAKILMKTGLRRLPVVVRQKLVGIVTVSDIVGAIGQMDIGRPIKDFIRDGVVAVWEETPVPVVSEIIRLSKHDALPVLNTKRELTGIISITDIINLSRIEDSVEKSDMSAGSDEDKWTWESMRDTMSLYYGVSRISLPDVPVKSVMVKDVITAFHKTAVSDCAKKMKRNRIEQVPVITAENKLDGLLIDRELLAVLVNGSQ